MTEHLELKGEIIFTSKGLFKVLVGVNENNKDGQIVHCKISGKLRQNKINLIVGDFVKVKVSPYDLSNGFIIYRL